MPKVVKVRIAVAVDPTGSWNASGWDRADDDEMMRMACEVLEDGEARYFLTAELPVPEIVDIPATVEPAS
jgi:hypothetical protein